VVDRLEVVAASVGYKSVIIFSRTFEQWIGCSPSEYRRSN